MRDDFLPLRASAAVPQRRQRRHQFDSARGVARSAPDEQDVGIFRLISGFVPTTGTVARLGATDPTLNRVVCSDPAGMVDPRASDAV